MDTMPDPNIAPLKALYANHFGKETDSVARLPQAGSDRIYYRLWTKDKEESAIGVFGPDKAENLAFQNFSRVFQKEGIPVPGLLSPISLSNHYLIEDLGDVSLFSLIVNRDSKSKGIEEDSMRLLARMQTVPTDSWHQFQLSGDFCRRQILWDLNYFKYSFVKPAGIGFDEERLENDFDRFAEDLYIPQHLWGFMYRDFQSRNVMVKDGKTHFIDYQGGRFGPCVYDAVSFVTQAKAKIPEARRTELLKTYADEFSRIKGTNPVEILRYAKIFALFRTLQVLGAYGFRGLVQHRAHFVESIPDALSNLGNLMQEEMANRYPELKGIADKLTKEQRFNAIKEPPGKLTVSIFSFSYKKGYPDDFSGNGGGFMFDCRALHNPGRYEEYKQLTGRDKPVADFLEKRGEADRFLRSAWEMTDKSVERYIKRGFTNLQIGFGCTGGQHRSVYCAEATARHIANAFPGAVVLLTHREQGIYETLNSTRQ